MKKLAGLITMFSFALFVTLAVSSNKLVLAKGTGLHRVTSSYINKVGEHHQYYRFNQNTTFKYGGKTVTLPCGRQVQLIQFRSLRLSHFTYVSLIKVEPPLFKPDM